MYPYDDDFNHNLNNKEPENNRPETNRPETNGPDPNGQVNFQLVNVLPDQDPNPEPGQNSYPGRPVHPGYEQAYRQPSQPGPIPPDRQAPGNRNIPGNRHIPGDRPDKKEKKPSVFRKVAAIVGSALLFGSISGVTMSAIYTVGTKDSGAAQETTAQIVKPTEIPTEAVVAAAAESGTKAATPMGAVNDVSAIVEKVMPSVVAITSTMEYESQGFWGAPLVYEGQGNGSGIIVGENETELLVVTNNHVVEGAKSITVVFTDEEYAEANIKGTDSENDLAVIAIPLDAIKDATKEKIAVARLGSSDNLKVGQGVIAIGNALGYGQSVTVGYVSALDREVRTDMYTTRNLLQTDAAINPGNSGGALINMQGEVIGINSAKYTSTEVEGMGYAIPISKVQDIIDTLMTRKTRTPVAEKKQGYLGVQLQEIDVAAASSYGMPRGLFIYKILEGGAAAESDLKEKDIITKFDEQPVRTVDELRQMLGYYEAGDSVELTVQSLKDGEYVERKVSITLDRMPEEQAAD